MPASRGHERKRLWEGRARVLTSALLTSHLEFINRATASLRPALTALCSSVWPSPSSLASTSTRAPLLRSSSKSCCGPRKHTRASGVKPCNAQHGPKVSELFCELHTPSLCAKLSIVGAHIGIGLFGVFLEEASLGANQLERFEKRLAQHMARVKGSNDANVRWLPRLLGDSKAKEPDRTRGQHKLEHELEI
eukprot:3822912-Rhodomonas_salina.1